MRRPAFVFIPFKMGKENSAGSAAKKRHTDKNKSTEGDHGAVLRQQDWQGARSLVDVDQGADNRD